MKLQNSFYHIDCTSATKDEFLFDISFNADHVIYRAHFPEKPITPGVCILQIAQELLELQIRRYLHLIRVVNVKYLAVLSPTENTKVTYRFSKLTEGEKDCKVHVQVENANGTFAKLSLVFGYEDFCILIPTFNNEQTIVQIVERAQKCAYPIIIVNDGSTDRTKELLQRFADKMIILHQEKNRGKGIALKIGLAYAKEAGFRYAITIDSDGQHYPEDIPLLVNEVQKHPDALITGSRNLQSENRSKNSTFANKFSNFWFYVQTGKRLPDTQTGFRLYPLHKMKHFALLTAKYEAELELLVFASWHGIELRSIPVRVYYPPLDERVSHFRPFIDFARISLLNTFLCCAAIVYGLPLRIGHFIRRISR